MNDQPRDDYRDAIGSFVDQSVRLAKAERERDEMRQTVARVEALHVDDGTGHCKACAGLADWPCPTIATLTEAGDGRG